MNNPFTIHKRIGSLGIGAMLLTFTIIMTGCTLGPNFIRPTTKIDQQWLEARDAHLRTEAPDLKEWWKVFDDPTLNRLIEIAYKQNLDLQVAGLRIYEARARLGVAVGYQYPQKQEIGGSTTTNQISEHAPNAAQSDKFYQDYETGFDASWELDFWGRFRRGVESANAELFATIAEYDDALVSLTAEVARTYVAIRTYEKRLEYARENVKSQEKALELAKARYQEGVTTRLDVTQAASLLKQTESIIPNLEMRLRQAKNAMAVLLGTTPGEIQKILDQPGPIPTAPDEVVVGIPAELLRRRPDVKAAEYQAAAQCARIGIAKSELFPRFTLGGFIGFETSEKGSTLSNNNAHLSDLLVSSSINYLFGPFISFPLFNYGRLKNNVRVEDARYQQAIATYQNTVLKAAQEAENAMIGFLKSQREAELLAQSVEHYRESMRIALLQYRAGDTSYQRVVDIQRDLTREEDKLAAAKGAIATNLIAIYKALGGGWQMRLGHSFVPEHTLDEMRQRTDWGSLLDDQRVIPKGERPPTGREVPLFNRPDF